MSHRTVRLLLLAVVGVMTVSGCQSAVSQLDDTTTASLTQGQSAPRGGDLRVGVLGDLSPKTFLQIGSDALNGSIVSNVYDTLIRYARDDLTPKPSLAKRWTLAPDGLELSLDLRDDVRFHNGRPFVSADVEQSLKAYLSGPWKPQFKRTAAAITAFDTADPHRVVLHFAHPLSNIFDLLDSAPIIDAQTLPQLKAGTTFNGTGPFKFVSWQPNSSVRLERNSQYWDGPPPLDSVTFVEATDQQSLYTRLRTGQLDLAYGMTYHDQQLATGRYGFRSITMKGAEQQQYVGIDLKNSQLSDIRLRQAIAYALDRPRIIGDVFRDNGYVVNAPWPKWSPAYRAADNTRYRRDVARAKALVAAHGSVAPITLDYSTRGVDRIIAQIVQSNLKDVGIPVILRPNDQTRQAAKLIGGEFGGLWLLQHAFAQFTPSTLAVSAYPFNAAKNSSNYTDAEYAAAATTAWSVPNGESDIALSAYRKLTEHFLNDLFLVEIGVVFQPLATSPSVGNVDWDRRNQFHFATTYLTKKGRH
ncbi:putative ABC transporter substrate binding protein [Gordonia effusa NBRC 100432]|uniref:Putative ABC transporter substrate binding protein n=1 Tax=Gordonia effusa NBRC 100432 TaxID=1077974 RepID=H0QVA1_9ACTN|nr:ABC transporter substrate-binding protein [Gordonia effusa]GAB16752.1 putative ABC transporter substrate binding protein [Gordonia effusa NBRC 100432]